MSVLNNQASIGYTELGENLSINSNVSIFNLLGNDLTVVKSQIPTQGISGTECTFTVIITNTSILNTITNLNLVDNLAVAGYTFVAGSVTINGTANTGNVQTGLTLTNLLPLGIHTVVFKATAN